MLYRPRGPPFSIPSTNFLRNRFNFLKNNYLDNILDMYIITAYGTRHEQMTLHGLIDGLSTGIEFLKGLVQEFFRPRRVYGTCPVYRTQPEEA